MYYKAFVVVCVFICADFVSGICSALYLGEFKSRLMREGLIHKVTELAIIGLAYGVEICLPYIGIEINVPLVVPIVCYLVVMEIGSIIENLVKINPDMRKVADKFLGDYEQKEGEDNEN